MKNLIASAGEWVVSQITATVGNFGTAKVQNGLEMKDSATGAVYCVRITNGEFAKIAGACPVLDGHLPADSEDAHQGTSGDVTAPVLTVNGANPAHIDVGVSYTDLGAMVEDNINHNLGVKAIVDGTDVGDQSNIRIDTASSTTHTIEYYALDQAGNRGSATRTVVVGQAVADSSAEITSSTPSQESATTTTESTTRATETDTAGAETISGTVTAEEPQSDPATPVPETPEATPETPAP